jgi:hypothetical protein
MSTRKETLWGLARSGLPIDAADLAGAIEDQAGEEHPDFRTRLLIRDGLRALAARWGQDRLDRWVAASPTGPRLDEFRRSDPDLGPAGFPSLIRRMMDSTKSQTILQFLRDLGSRIDRPARLEIGGSTALILRDLLDKHTDAIDVVDGFPPALVGRHALLEDLLQRYGLRLAHFQSHFLPVGWENRLRSLGRFDSLEVFLVDACDVLLSILFSPREKDLDDLRAALRIVDKAELETRLKQSAGPFLAEPRVVEHARRNWHVLFGEPLPGDAA